MSADPTDVDIGDTFARSGEADPWEVTRHLGGSLWTLDRGPAWRFAVSRDLLDTAQWVRVRAL